MQKINFFTEVTFLCSLKIIAGVFERMSFLTKCNFGLVIYEAISYNVSRIIKKNEMGVESSQLIKM